MRIESFVKRNKEMKLAPSDSFIFLTSRFIDPTELKHSLENYFFDNGRTYAAVAF
jgi:hypothetical protein